MNGFIVLFAAIKKSPSPGQGFSAILCENCCKLDNTSAYDAEINFDKRHGGGRPKRVAATGRGTDWEPVFCCCVQSVISLMKWSKIQGELPWMAISGSLRHGCRLLPTRSVRYHISISLVKSDWKLQQKTGSPPAPFPVAATPFGLPPPWRLSKLISVCL